MIPALETALDDTRKISDSIAFMSVFLEHRIRKGHIPQEQQKLIAEKLNKLYEDGLPLREGFQQLRLDIVRDTLKTKGE